VGYPASFKRSLRSRLFGARSTLVHDGSLPYGRDKLGEILNKLEAVDTSVLRALGGLPYAGQLDKCFP
jgi:hypothetical protein